MTSNSPAEELPGLAAFDQSMALHGGSIEARGETPHRWATARVIGRASLTVVSSAVFMGIVALAGYTGFVEGAKLILPPAHAIEGVSQMSHSPYSAHVVGQERGEIMLLLRNGAQPLAAGLAVARQTIENGFSNGLFKQRVNLSMHWASEGDKEALDSHSRLYGSVAEEGCETRLYLSPRTGRLLHLIEDTTATVAFAAAHEQGHCEASLGATAELPAAIKNLLTPEQARVWLALGAGLSGQRAKNEGIGFAASIISENYADAFGAIGLLSASADASSQARALAVLDSMQALRAKTQSNNDETLDYHAKAPLPASGAAPYDPSSMLDSHTSRQALHLARSHWEHRAQTTTPRAIAEQAGFLGALGALSDNPSALAALRDPKLPERVAQVVALNALLMTATEQAGGIKHLPFPLRQIASEVYPGLARLGMAEHAELFSKGAQRLLAGESLFELRAELGAKIKADFAPLMLPGSELEKVGALHRAGAEREKELSHFKQLRSEVAENAPVPPLGAERSFAGKFSDFSRWRSQRALALSPKGSTATAAPQATGSKPL